MCLINPITDITKITNNIGKINPSQYLAIAKYEITISVANVPNHIKPRLAIRLITKKISNIIIGAMCDNAIYSPTPLDLQKCDILLIRNPTNY